VSGFSRTSQNVVSGFSRTHTDDNLWPSFSFLVLR